MEHRQFTFRGLLFVCVDNLAGTAPQPHPVWGTPDPDVAKYIRLLQYLCGEELMRLRVWTDPLRHADSSRAAPVVRSSRLRKLFGSCCTTPSTPQEPCTGRRKVAREGLMCSRVPVAWPYHRTLVSKARIGFCNCWLALGVHKNTLDGGFLTAPQLSTLPSTVQVTRIRTVLKRCWQCLTTVPCLLSAVAWV